MPYSPQRRRRSSGFSLTPLSPQSIAFAPTKPSNSRRSSIQSLRTPTTPRPPSSHDRTSGFNFSSELVGSAGTENGLGSLADELAEAWNNDSKEEGEGDDEGEGEAEGEGEGEGDGNIDGHVSSIQAEDEVMCTRLLQEPRLLRPQDWDEKNMIGLARPLALEEKPTSAQSPPKHGIWPKSQQEKTVKTGYKSPDNSAHSDNEETGLPASLETRMAVIHALAKQGAALTRMEANSIFVRIKDSLKDLRVQSAIESRSNRLSTAYIALTSHITEQTRLLQALAHPVLSPVGIPPSAEPADALLSLLSSLILSLPQPPISALPMLHSLSASTTDLLSTLSYLSDTLHMARQTTTLAARRLRAARELVDRMMRDVEEAEEGVRWIERGGWDGRLKDREAARVCGEVVGGFEEVCAEWRKRLIGQGGGGVEVVGG